MTDLSNIPGGSLNIKVNDDGTISPIDPPSNLPDRQCEHGCTYVCKACGLVQEYQKTPHKEEPEVRNLPFMANLRLTIWVWLFGLILPLVPKQAIKTLRWILEMPRE